MPLNTKLLYTIEVESRDNPGVWTAWAGGGQEEEGAKIEGRRAQGKYPMLNLRLLKYTTTVEEVQL